MSKTAKQSYLTLDDIQQRKDELREQIQQSGEQIGTLWYDLFTPKKANTRGELVAAVISNGITAFDTFMLVRKLMNRYGKFFFHKDRKRK